MFNLFKRSKPDYDDVYQRAADYCEFVPTDSDEPRCDITGRPLTVREQFERECG